MDQDSTQASVSINIDIDNVATGETGSPEDISAAVPVAMGGSELIDVPVGEDQGVAVSDLAATTGQLNLGEFAGSEVDLSESPEQQEKTGEDGSALLTGDVDDEVPLEGERQEERPTIEGSGEGDIEQKVPEDLLTFSPSSESETTLENEQQLKDPGEQSVDGVCVSKQIKEDIIDDDMQPSVTESENQREQDGEYIGFSPLEDNPVSSEPVDIEGKSNSDDGFETQVVGSPASNLTQDTTHRIEKVEEENVRKFFADEDVSSGDIEGKSFFDSFTTGGVDSLTDSSASVTSHRSGSFSQVETTRRSGSFSQAETSSPTSKDPHPTVPTTPPINEVFTSHSPVPTSPPITDVRASHTPVPTTPPINEVFTSQPPQSHPHRLLPTHLSYHQAHWTMKILLQQL
ncbi:uncharacterized protein [Ptychodera flava]|uniref:uncharacterized protein n=1 Tax=Ptychodera flava TaxID=63121 RepID=UPI00396A82E3